jgi:hypothetical protein
MNNSKPKSSVGTARPKLAGLVILTTGAAGSLFAAEASGVAAARLPIPPIWWLAPSGALLALGAAAFLYRWMKIQPEGDAMQIKIAACVRSGVRTYLNQQYKVVALVFAAVFCVAFAFFVCVSGAVTDCAVCVLDGRIHLGLDRVSRDEDGYVRQQPHRGGRREIAQRRLAGCLP